MARVLIVDDPEFARHRLQRIFETGGHQIVGKPVNPEILFATLTHWLNRRL